MLPSLQISRGDYIAVAQLLNRPRLSATHGLQYARLPSLSPWVCLHSCPLSQWYHPTISSYVALFSSCPQCFLPSGSFLKSGSTRLAALGFWCPSFLSDKTKLLRDLFIPESLWGLNDIIHEIRAWTLQALHKYWTLFCAISPIRTENLYLGIHNRK